MPKPPLQPLAVSIVVGQLKIVLPVAALGLLIVALAPGLAALLVSRAELKEPIPAPPSQTWTTGPGTMATFARVLPGSLPPPDPRQRKPPCAVKMGEESINGVCWLRLDVRPPCPQDQEGVAWEHNGKCYAYALRAERSPRGPTSGEPSTPAVADP